MIACKVSTVCPLIIMMDCFSDRVDLSIKDFFPIISLCRVVESQGISLTQGRVPTRWHRKRFASAQTRIACWFSVNERGQTQVGSLTLLCSYC